MAQLDRTPTKNDLRLLRMAEARIDVAVSELLLAIKGMKDANKSQEVAVAELHEAKEAIRALRERIEENPA